MGSLDDSGKPYDLDGQLMICLQEFMIDREDHWSARSEGGDWGPDRLFGHAERVATMLLKGADDLVNREPLPEEPVAFSAEHTKYLDEITGEIKSLLAHLESKQPDQELMATFDRAVTNLVLDQRPEDDTLLKVVWDRLCIHMAEDATGRLVRGANRILQLSRFYLRTAPSDQTVKFLRHVSRCFIWGFDAECVILCRGALDTAFRKAVPDELCDRHKLKKAKFGHTYSNRVKAASLEGMIDVETKKAAFRVNKPATIAVHDNPELVRDVVSIVQDTCDVLQRLLPNHLH